ncbi:MAG: glycine cleavage system aminomethyltransferase GcvT [Thaumarchaeota archaeon]|nr:glycine cleavage system aminomethyltransferase GcvT [Nitrososphaerota archaeon]
MLKETQLHSYHAEHGKLTEFAGYEMPLWYTTTTEEHLAVRNGSGIFDVSHMGRLAVRGEASTAFVEGLVPTSVARQQPGKAFYTLLLNDRGGIIDDLIVARLGLQEYLLVVNAANAVRDLDHVKALAPAHGVEIEDLTPTSIMIAVQGPGAQRSLQGLADVDLAGLKRFRSSAAKVLGQPSLISRTGYTGEDGFEVIIHGPTVESPGEAVKVWEGLAATSVPCGLGARDSLRLEAGFPLHGTDIGEDTDPFQADLAWVLSSDKGAYVGSTAVSELRSHPPGAVRRGVVLDQGIPRHGFDVLEASGKVGTVTSGTFSPILKKGIALCRVETTGSEPGTEVSVVVRESPQPGHIVKPPFYDEDVYGWKSRGNGK